jgi:hypothetical protein
MGTNPSNFTGPLPTSLTRDEYGTVRLRNRYRTARDFVLATADFMRTMGREVTVTDEPHKVSAYGHGKHMFDSGVSVVAFRNTRRWKFGHAFAVSRNITETTYRDARILVEVYGR